MAHKGIKLGTISSHQIFSTLNKWHGLNTALRRILHSKSKSVKNVVSDKVSGSVLWERAVFALSARLNAEEIDGLLELRGKGKSLSIEEETYFREALVALKLAKDVIKLQQEWRANAIAHLNRSGGFSRSLANSCTDWPYLLIELLSQAAETDHFQVIVYKCRVFCLELWCVIVKSENSIRNLSFLRLVANPFLKLMQCVLLFCSVC